MSHQYDPSIITINNKYVNTGNIYSLAINDLSMQLDYFSGDKELFQFGSQQELDKARQKIYAAQLALDFGTNHTIR